ncbi:MAG: PilZ domain-containing protein [Myxococcales bacterium]
MTDKPIARIRFATWREFARFLTRKGAESGLFVRTTQPLPIGTELQIQLHFPDDSALDLSARVATGDSDGAAPGMGVVLTSMSAEEAEVLMNAIRRASARSPEARPAAPRAAAVAPAAVASTRDDPGPTRTDASGAEGPVSTSEQDPRPAPRPVHAERFNEVFRLAAASKFDRAEERVRQMLAERPDDTEARIWQLVIQARRFRSQFLFDEAMEKYEAVLMIDGAHEEARSELDALGAEAETSKDLMQRVFGDG